MNLKIKEEVENKLNKLCIFLHTVFINIKPHLKIYKLFIKFHNYLKWINTQIERVIHGTYKTCYQEIKYRLKKVLKK